MWELSPLVPLPRVRVPAVPPLCAMSAWAVSPTAAALAVELTSLWGASWQQQGEQAGGMLRPQAGLFWVERMLF